MQLVVVGYVYLLSNMSSCPLLSPEALGIANVDYYWYLNQTGTYTVDGMDDRKEFQDTLVRCHDYRPRLLVTVSPLSMQWRLWGSLERRRLTSSTLWLGYSILVTSHSQRKATMLSQRMMAVS